jgi:hypothetical protein
MVDVRAARVVEAGERAVSAVVPAGCLVRGELDVAGARWVELAGGWCVLPRGRLGAEVGSCPRQMYA